MTSVFDAVVVGAGFAGASTAYHLTQKGLRNLLILEQEPEPGQHASGRNASLAFQQLSDGDEARLAVEGRDFIAAPPDDFCDHALLRACGSLLLADADGARGLAATAAKAAALGGDSGMVTRTEACARVPILADSDFVAACWTPSDGVVDIRALLRGYLDGALRAGAELRCGAAITAIDTSGGRLRSLQTSAGPVQTSLLVNAAGAWAGEVGRLAGAGTRTLGPRRRHMYRIDVDFAVDPDWPFVWHDDVDVYFRPDAGQLLTSPCDATPHPAQAPEIDATMESTLFAKLGQAFPHLLRARVATRWACLRTFTADERFLIGRDPEITGLVWVAGLGGHGMTTSPAVGRLGALAALGEDSPELAPFSPARFAGM